MQPPGYPPGYPPQYGPPPQYGAPPQPAYGRPPYPSQPYGAPPPRPKSKAPLFIGLGVGALVVVGVVGAVGYFAYGKYKRGSLPLEANKLPAQTRELDTRLIDATREDNARVKKIYLASELADGYCSGHMDPATHLELLGAWDSKAAKDFFAPKHLEAVRDVLACGAQLAASLDDNHASYLGFDADDDSGKSDILSRHRVRIGHFKMKTMPPMEGYTSVSFGTMPGFCQTTAPPYASASPLAALLTPSPAGSAASPTTTTTTTSCSDKSNAAFAVGSTWFFSDKATLDELSKTILVPKTTLPTRVAALQDAFNETSNLPQVVLVAEPESSKKYLEYPCDWAASELGIRYFSSASGSTTASTSSDIKTHNDFVQACFPEKADGKIIEEIDAKLRAIAFETDPDYVRAGAVTGNIVLVTRDEDTAKDAERAVKELVGDWKSQIELDAPKLIKAGKDQASTMRQKKFSDVSDTYFQALSKMKITRSGRTIKISYKAPFTKEDETELKGDLKADEKRLAVTDVLEAVRDRKPIPQSALAKLVGNSWATYLLLPPLPTRAPSPMTKLTVEECKSVQSKLQSVHLADLPSAGDSRTAYSDQKYITCEYRQPQVTEDQKKCLATFTTPNEYAACMGGDSYDPRTPPESEFGDKKKRSD